MTVEPGARQPSLDTVFTVNPDGSRNVLHPADVSGRWQRRKSVIWAVLAVVYLVLPFLTVGGRQAMLVDIPRRQAFLFGATFTNQDVYLLFFVLAGAGFALIVVTSLWGRVWCGFACPQTVWMEGFARRFERWLEGPRQRRIARDRGPLTLDTAWRRTVKHLLFLALAVVVAHAFIAYFIPARHLLEVIRSGPAAHWTAFGWVTVMTAVLYVDFAWFREQTCVVVCPYGRLQSALVDDETVIIGYDRGRGEPRVKATRPGGDCVDCRRCVVVCPTGIDIRNGLQLECVGCASCIDACDAVMDRLGRKRGLVRYDSERGFAGRPKRRLRARVVLYAAVGLVGAVVFALAAVAREPFEVRALRVRGLPYRVEEGVISNLLTLAIQNKSAEAVELTVEVRLDDGPAALAPEVVVGQPTVRLEGLHETTVPVFVRLPRERYTGPFPLRFVVRDPATGAEREVEGRFLGP